MTTNHDPGDEEREVTACPCGRPRATDAEMLRWQRDVRHAAFGSHELDWAKAICWSYPGQECDPQTR